MAKTRRRKAAPDEAPRMSGKDCLYRPKVRQPRNYTMTAEDHVLVDTHLQRTGLSRGDFFTSLVRQFGARVQAGRTIAPPEV
jgi:hypothetical protein